MDTYFQRDHVLNEILYNIMWTVGNYVTLASDIFEKKNVI